MDSIGNNQSKLRDCSVWDGVKVKAVKERYRQYLITSAEELAWVAKIVNSGKRNFAGKKILLRCDADLGNYPWTPVGISECYPFCGVFDGGGHSVYGINVRGNFEYVGFFGCVMGNGEDCPAMICNLQLLELNVQGLGLFSCSGGLAGSATRNVEISNCVVTGNVASTNCAGGLVGVAEEQVSVINCMVSGTITGTYNVGGIVCRLLEETSVRGCRVTMNDLQEVWVDSGVPDFDDASTASECNS